MTGKICYTIERCVRGLSLAGTTEYAPVAQLDRALDSDSKGRWFESSRAYQKNFPLLYGRGKFFIQLFPPVMGSCSPPTDVKMRRPVYDLGYHESFDCNNFLGIYSKTSRSYSCLQRKLPLQELVETLVHLRSQSCEHGLHHQRLHHIKLQKRSYTHPQMCRTNIL